MKRRELLKALAALPTALVFKDKKGESIATAVQIDERAKYICFVNSSAIDVEEFCKQENGLPAGTPVIPLHPDDMDNAVRIFKVSE